MYKEEKCTPFLPVFLYLCQTPVSPPQGTPQQGGGEDREDRGDGKGGTWMGNAEDLSV